MAKNAKFVAEAEMPGWVAVESLPVPDGVTDAAPAGIDSVGVNLEQLKAKYFGQKSSPRGADVGAAVAPAQPIDSDDSALVVMERPVSVDSSPNRKTVLVHGNRVIGTQG